MRHALLGAWTILVVAIAVGFWRLEQLGNQNRDRIADIQRSRIEACETTYRSFRVVFEPFFPAPAKRTAAERRSVARLNHITATRAKQCRAAVTPPPTSP